MLRVHRAATSRIYNGRTERRKYYAIDVEGGEQPFAVLSAKVSNADFTDLRRTCVSRL